ncbi:ribosome maturation protein RimP [Aurantiacibacter xanthus]|uniref:Ribosome maturation factor RimP n=1 Tax=Aurantiacibacter xanthus TaxID=1784712 RepID=A0A3A1P413_9SPHN|nr:ribosome maturation protein RimP [Aurantiacibacter xanthus]RIV86400.1 ribosome maturation protein RimP [Aurantiacibacter xanthus]
MSDLTRLISIIEPEAATLGFELVRVRMAGSGEERTLQIMAEDPATGQMVVEQCATLSRAISNRIDAIEEEEGELIEGAYMLEVSSPGIDRPLTRAKDYANWAGHEARISLVEKIGDHRKLKGELLGIEGETVTIRDNKAGEIAVALANIHSAQLELTDKLIAATLPLDAEGADEFEEDAVVEE